MPTTGIQRLPAISRTIGLTKAATNRTARRARGPRLMALVVLLIQPGRATGRQCDVGLECHIPGPCPVLLCVASSVKESNERFTDAWTNHHRFLLDVAYRLLGSYSDAEDLVQEAFSRLLRTDLDPIEDIRAWLVVVVSRLCIDPVEQRRVVDAFIAACAGGDIAKLLPMLDPSVVGWADLGGGRTLPGVSRPNVGRDMVGDRVMRFFGAESGNQLVAKVINGEPSVVAFFEGAVASVLALSVSDGLISRIYVVSDPRKLAQVKRMLEQQN